MTTATRRYENEKVVMEITLTRKVIDKVAFADGYNINMGREVYENYDVKMTIKAIGKTIYVHGKPGGFAFFQTAGKFSKFPAGAYARIGDAYLTEQAYNIAMGMIAELDAEVTKTDEQIALEHAEMEREQAADRALRAEARAYAQEIKNGLCPKCGTYCYGDCDANR